MTVRFTEFLRERAAREAAEQDRARDVVNEWRASITGLFEKMQTWLRESDPDGRIRVEQKDQELTEEGLGRYVVPRLNLRAFGKWVGVIPKARNTVATARPPQKGAPERASGRVDIMDETTRYVLYRFQGEEGDRWMIDDLRSPPRALDQEAFEAALMSYLL